MNKEFYYDFAAETPLIDWIVTAGNDNTLVLQTTWKTAEPGSWTLLFDTKKLHQYILLDGFCGNRKFAFNWQDSAIVYPSSSSSIPRHAFHAELMAGQHLIRIRVRLKNGQTCAPQNFLASIIPTKCCPPPKPFSRNIKIPHAKSIPAKQPAIPNLKDWIPGIGTTPGAGRFGFTKGDGLLDCAMPLLGVIDKAYLCGHPKYNQPHKWTVSLLPPGIDPATKYHGSQPPATTGLENDILKVNHLATSWTASFKTQSGFFGRKAGAKIKFACTYSLASAGIWVESSDPGISLSMLEYAGNYQYLLIPGKTAIKCTALDRNLRLDDKMAENWLLLFGATEYPDLPILLVFTRAPAQVLIRRNAQNRLTSLDFYLPPRNAKMFVATPFGIENFELRSPHHDAWLADAVTRCRFWARAALAYPIRCREYFKLDKQNEKVAITQKFEYRIFKDQWRTPPLYTAPLPPTLSMLDGTGIAETEDDIRDFKFPTKYGFLKGTIDLSFSSYKIPWSPCERRFPLRNIHDKNIPGLLAQDLGDYFKFHDQFPATQRAYPYPGAALEPYAWAAPLFNYMDENSRAKMAVKLGERLKIACDTNHRYEYPAIKFHSLFNEMPAQQRVLEIYRDPAMQRFRLFNWYQRKEPFTGATYRICYLNVGLFGNRIKHGTRAEIAALKPLIENDWGAGLTFYYMYIAALVSGSFKPIAQSWPTICEAFAYFEKFHDWACMGSAYCENGNAWIEGANYGAFTGFVNMAEAVADQVAYARGVYIAAKQMALRLAILRSAQTYFHRFFNRAPWYITKLFNEEADPAHGFLHAPKKLWQNKYTGIYNLTTEGLYPELFAAFHKFLPQEWKIVRSMALRAYAKGVQHDPANSYGEVQACASCLISAALDENCAVQKTLQEIKAAEQRGHLLKEWRGIHAYSRLLPKNFFKCQLLAWLDSRAHPLWLEHWTDTAIKRAIYDPIRHEALIEFEAFSRRAMIRCGIRQKPVAALLNDKPVTRFAGTNNKMEFCVRGSGALKIIFQKHARS